MLIDYLKENYEMGEPIFPDDIAISFGSEAALLLEKLYHEGKLEKFDSETYYFPKTTILGTSCRLSADTVAMYKYIMRRGKRIGYYCGNTLLNRMGLSTQVPVVEEICSNLVTEKEQEILLNGRKYILRKPSVTVDEENVFVLHILDCLENFNGNTDISLRELANIMEKYMRAYDITDTQIKQYMGYYSKSTEELWKKIKKFEVGIKNNQF